MAANAELAMIRLFRWISPNHAGLAFCLNYPCYPKNIFWVKKCLPVVRALGRYVDPAMSLRSATVLNTQRSEEMGPSGFTEQP